MLRRPFCVAATILKYPTSRTVGRILRVPVPSHGFFPWHGQSKSSHNPAASTETSFAEICPLLNWRTCNRRHWSSARPASAVVRKGKREESSMYQRYDQKKRLILSQEARLMKRLENRPEKKLNLKAEWHDLLLLSTVDVLK